MVAKEQNWHTFPAETLTTRLKIDMARDLSEEEARRRPAQTGLNRLREEEGEPLWEALLQALRALAAEDETHEEEAPPGGPPRWRARFIVFG